MSKPSYLFVVPWGLEHVGGVNQVVIELARQMQATGSYEPIVLIADWDAPEPVWADFQGLRTLRWRIRPLESGMGIKARLLYHLWLHRFRKVFAAFCEEHDIRVINLHYVQALAVTLDRLRGLPTRTLPLLLSFHGLDLTKLGQLPGADLAVWRALLPRTTVVACSHDLGRRFVAVFGDVVTPVVIHNGIEAKRFRSMAAPPIRPEGERYILNIGKFELKKGQDVLLDAFASLAEDYPDLHLVMVGARDVVFEPLQAQCKALDLNERVHFYTDRPHQEMAGFLSHATFFVLPSRSEAFPIVVMEAGALGVPIVATAVGGVPEAIDDGVSGLLVPAESVPELARALRRFLDDPEAARQMAGRLQNRVSSEFTWRAAHDRYLDAIQR